MKRWIVELWMRGLGCREKAVEFHWNASDPWTLVSSSLDQGVVGGGTLQVWRLNDFITLSEEEAIARAEQQVCLE